MQVLIYQLGDCTCKLLAAAIAADPAQKYILVPAELARAWKMDGRPTTLTAQKGDKHGLVRCL